MMNIKFYPLLLAVLIAPNIVACSRKTEAEHRAEIEELYAQRQQRKAEAMDFERQRESIERQNREIDKAQDEVIENYRKKASKHTISGGPGGRIDQFIMKNGAIVTCRTTITNSGKAVDCS